MGIRVGSAPHSKPEAEVVAIHLAARCPSNLLGPLVLPGTIAAERYDSDDAGSDFDPDKKVKSTIDDESSIASDSSADKSNDKDILDIKKRK